MVISEHQLADSFVNTVVGSAHLRHRGLMLSFASESPALQGRPDFVGSNIPIALIDEPRMQRLAKLIQNRDCARVLAPLQRGRAHRIKHIAGKAGLAESRVDKLLQLLVSRDVVEEKEGKKFRLSASVGPLDCELWAVELKVENWRRALYQAITHKTFAHRITVIMPSTWRHGKTEAPTLYERFGIGLSTLDLGNNTLRAVVGTRKERPLSRTHFYYALGHFIHTAAEQQPRAGERNGDETVASHMTEDGSAPVGICARATTARR